MSDRPNKNDKKYLDFPDKPTKHFSIVSYSNDQDKYIDTLEQKIAEIREECYEMISLIASGAGVGDNVNTILKLTKVKEVS